MARLSPGRVRTVNAVPTRRPARWNGLKPRQPASRARLSEMIDVGLSLNASISAAGGFATDVAAMATLMLIGSLPGSGAFRPPAHRVRGCIFMVRIARREAACLSHSRQSDMTELD